MDKILVSFIVFLFFIVIATIIPIKNVMLSDSILYGDEWCNDRGDCVSTKGHYTETKLTLYELIKYRKEYGQVPLEFIDG